MATPATGLVSGTPASISDKVVAHTEPIEEEPLLSSTSDITRMEYGKVVSGGSIGSTARSARAPCPISRRPGPRNMRVSPTLNGGKL